MNTAAPIPVVESSPPRRGPALGRIRALTVPPILKNRLVQFALIGGSIFAVAPPSRSSRDVDLRSADISALYAAEARRKGAPLADDRIREVDQRAVEDEILYREGLRLGFDRNDGIVRQRVVQKVLFLAEELGGATKPASSAELRAFFDQNRERFRVPERIRFAQVFSRAREPLAAWAAGDRAGDPPRGEPPPRGPEMQGTREQLVGILGAELADAIAAAPVGAWTGPLRSAFGWHLVRVIAHDPAREARFEEVRPAVTEAANVFRRQEAIARYLERAFAQYEVSVDGKRVTSFTPTRRLAYRSDPSGED